MSWFWEAILGAVPWWAWLAISIVLLASVHRFIGWKGIIAGASAIGAVMLFKRGQAVGEERINRKNQEAADALEQHYEDIATDNPPDLERDISRLHKH
jgi:hypothetical protein